MNKLPRSMRFLSRAETHSVYKRANELAQIERNSNNGFCTYDSALRQAAGERYQSTPLARSKR